MRKFVIVVVLFFVFAGTVFGGMITPGLQKKLEALGSAGTIRVHVHLLAGPDWQMLEEMSSQKARIAYLQDIAHISQKEILAFVSNCKDVSEIHPFWISNVITLTASREMIEEIAQRDDVDWIGEDTKYFLLDFPFVAFISATPDNTALFDLQWNILKIRAKEVWNTGLTGQGIVIGFIDSGIDATHQAIKNQRRSFDSWFDGVSGLSDPYDDIGHGTHCTGIACGKFGYGVAPGAQWVMARAFESGMGRIEWIRACFEWYAGQENPPDIISNSWGAMSSTSLEFWDDLMIIRALGIIPVFAVGNSGNWGTSTPGNYPIVIGVGATDKCDDIASFSSRGPAPDISPWNNPEYWGRKDWNLTKPDISAPGVDVNSSIPGGQYAKKSGTSMAAPHIAGLIALMLEKKPDMTYREIYSILLDSAAEPFQGEPYPNNDYGWGRVDAFQAVDMVNVPKAEKTCLDVCYPNPFKSSTIIPFGLSSYGQVTLKIYDVSGRLVKTFFENEEKFPRYYFVRWDGRDDFGRKVSAGTYFCYFRTTDCQNPVKVRQKIVFLR